MLPLIPCCSADTTLFLTKSKVHGWNMPFHAIPPFSTSFSPAFYPQYPSHRVTTTTVIPYCCFTQALFARLRGVSRPLKSSTTSLPSNQ